LPREGEMLCTPMPEEVVARPECKQLQNGRLFQCFQFLLNFVLVV
jgi:hypothetical protein